MDAKRLGRLHELCDIENRSPREEAEMQKLIDEYNDDQWATLRRINAAANLPLDTDPWAGYLANQ